MRRHKFHVGERVISTRSSWGVTVGMRGTISFVSPISEDLYEVQFDDQLSTKLMHGGDLAPEPTIENNAASN